VFTVACEAPKTAPRSSPATIKTHDSFFRSPKYLTVSTQLHLEALAQSVGNVWALSPTFRAERSDTSRHLSEFYMLEAEMTFVDEIDEVMDLLEDMLKNMTKNLYMSKAAQELRQSGGDELARRWEGMMNPAGGKWPRITYTEAIDILKTEEHRFEHKPIWGAGLQAEHEKFLAKTVGGGRNAASHAPVFVTNYPRDIKAFYMRSSGSTLPSSIVDCRDAASTVDIGLGHTVDCFDLIVPELCEIAGGSMREHRLDQLLKSMESRGMIAPQKEAKHKGPLGVDGTHGSNLDWYIDLRRWGSPPHGGFGLGFDRLLGYLAGVQSVRDVVAFPRWVGRCDC
jgi:asparaginyl-tRNA synthetase